MGSGNSKNQTYPEEFHRPINGFENDPRYDYNSGHYEGKDYGRPIARENPPLHKKRSCTDVACLLLFVVFLGAWGFVAFMGFKEGNIEQVIYPTDSQGNVCGHDNRNNVTGEPKYDMRDRKFLMFFDLTQCLNPAVFVTGCLTPQVCVSRCPDENYFPFGLAAIGRGDSAIKSKMKEFCSPLINDPKFKDKTVKQLIKENICPPWYLKSSPYLGRCFPDPGKNDTKARDKNAVLVKKSDTVDGKEDLTEGTLDMAVNRLAGFLGLRELGERVFNDLSETYWMIGLALIGACVLSFTWIVLMRLLAGVMVWLTIFLIFVMVGGLLGYSSYRLYDVWTNGDESSLENIAQVNFTPYYLEDALKLRDTWIAFTVILGIFFLIILMIFIFLRKRIQIAISLIQQGSKAVGQMFSTLFFPIVPFLFQLIVAGWFLAIAMYLSSSGVSEFRVAIQEKGNVCLESNKGACLNPNTNQTYLTNDTCTMSTFSSCASQCPSASCNFVRYTKSSDISWMQVFNLFGLYWGIFFFAAFGELVLAGVFAEWYWTMNKKKNLRCGSLGRSLWNATVYHLGTIAFGSLILAIIRMIRVTLEYIEKKLKKFNNDLTKCLLCACKCCLWCLEKFMRFLNKNAYIMCAVKSTNFCRSAQDAFNLLMRNMVRVVVLDKVCDFLLFLGKMVITIGIGVVSYLAFGGYIPQFGKIPALNYFFTPIVFIVIGTYLIASAFFGVYSMAVDTLFLCFLEDLERNDGSQERPYYMSKDLQKILGKMQSEAHNEFSPSAPRLH